MAKTKNPICPSCGSTLKKGAARCDMCGADPNGGQTASRLSDEELREKLRKLRLQSVLSKAGLAVFSLGAVISLAAANWALLALFVIADIVSAVFAAGCSGQAKKLVGINVVRDALGEVFAIEEYIPGNFIGEAAVSEARLVHNWNESTGSDFVRGRYKGVGFIFSDVHLEDVQETTDSDGDTHETRTTRFRGQWMVLELRKNTGHTVRLREREQRKLSGNYTKQGKSDVETENAAFNQMFQIQTDDPHTAFYVLTPHFMDAIVAADQRASGRTYMCFMGDRVHIAVDNGRDSFELKRGGETRNIDALRARIRGEVKYITDIADELLRNTSLFAEGEVQVR